MLAIVGDIVGVDVATEDGACADANAYDMFVHTRLVDHRAPYSYVHFLVFAQLVKHYGSIETLTTLLDHARIYHGLSETTRLLVENNARIE